MAERTLHDLAFPTLDDKSMQSIAKVAHVQRFKDGDALFSAGDAEFKFFVIKSGKVEIIDVTGDAPKVIVAHEARQFTGDISHMTGNRAIVSGICRGGCEAYAICDDDLQRMLQDNQRLADVIMQAFIARRQLLESSPDFVGLRVIGSGFSPDTFRIRDFMARNHVPNTFLDLDKEKGVETLLKRFKVTIDQTPIVACAEMLVLRNPSNRELAEELGIRRPLEQKVYDLVIIGAGPAGLAAAVYGASEGLSTLMLERDSPGGQAGSSMRIENYLGFPLGITGDELIKGAVLQAHKFGASISNPSEAMAIETEGAYSTVSLDDEKVTARCLLIASGAEYGRLKAEGREKFEGRGVYYAATPVEAGSCVNSDVVLVGGGNSAGQASVYLATKARRVFHLIRGDDLYKNMSSYLARRIERSENAELLKNTEIMRPDAAGKVVHLLDPPQLEILPPHVAIEAIEDRLLLRRRHPPWVGGDFQFAGKTRDRSSQQRSQVLLGDEPAARLAVVNQRGHAEQRTTILHHRKIHFERVEELAERFLGSLAVLSGALENRDDLPDRLLAAQMQIRAKRPAAEVVVMTPRCWVDGEPLWQERRGSHRHYQTARRDEQGARSSRRASQRTVLGGRGSKLGVRLPASNGRFKRAERRFVGRRYREPDRAEQNHECLECQRTSTEEMAAARHGIRLEMCPPRVRAAAHLCRAGSE